MNSDPPLTRPADRLPEQFACRFLQSRGAIVETTAAGCHAVLPETLASQLEVPDLVRLCGDPGGAGAPPQAPAPGREAPAMGVHYGSTLLDKMVQLACSDIPVLTCDLRFDYIKSQGFDRLIADQFVFPNAVGKVESHALVRTRYVQITCRYRAQSDEQKEGLTSLAFNLETGASVPDMTLRLSGLDRTVVAAAPGAGADAPHFRRILKQAEGRLREQVAAETAEFRESMRRRFRRDAANLREYYAGLKGEMHKSLERPGLSPQAMAERREKINLIPAELRRKQDDLLKKYGIRISVQPGALMQIRTEAVKVLFRLSIGMAARTVPMIYNPVLKAMDPLVCEACGAPAYRCAFCGRRHLLCPACAGRCPLCSPAK